MKDTLQTVSGSDSGVGVGLEPLTSKHMESNTVLVLRTCNADGTSYGGFQWNLEVGATVTAPDWNPTPECGHGLHGALWGEGDGSLLSFDADAKWLVVETEAGSVVNLNGKVKFPSCVVRYAGDRFGATTFLAAHLPARANGYAIIGSAATAENSGTATAGDYGTATAGDRGTATAGDSGTATAGYRGTATAGDYGTATAGNRGTATAGNFGTATAGDYGTATAGNRGTATAGDYGTATAGDYGIISVHWWDGKRDRFALGYVGENGIEPNVAYKVVNGSLVQA